MKINKKIPLTPEQIADANRLKELYQRKSKDLKVNQNDIADELGVGQSAISHYMNAVNPLNTRAAAAFAKVLQVGISDFSPSLAKEASSISVNAGSASNVSYAGKYIAGNRYPVLSKVQAGAWSEAVEAYTLKDIDLWLESDAHIQGDAFWLEVDGDSMTAPIGLSIPEGTFVLFDTGRDPANGNLVIAKLTDSNEATFKKLVIDGSQWYLKGLNPAWPLTPINGNCRIIGVAVETKLRLL